MKVVVSQCSIWGVIIWMSTLTHWFSKKKVIHQRENHGCTGNNNVKMIPTSTMLLEALLTNERHL